MTTNQAEDPPSETVHGFIRAQRRPTSCRTLRYKIDRAFPSVPVVSYFRPQHRRVSANGGKVLSRAMAFPGSYQHQFCSIVAEAYHATRQGRSVCETLYQIKCGFRLHVGNGIHSWLKFHHVRIYCASLFANRGRDILRSGFERVRPALLRRFISSLPMIVINLFLVHVVGLAPDISLLSPSKPFSKAYRMVLCLPLPNQCQRRSLSTDIRDQKKKGSRGETMRS